MIENFKCKSDSSLELIGGTPLVKLNKVVPSNGSNIFVKLESTNPGGSVKDRIALSMVEDAEKTGLLKPGATIIEPTTPGGPAGSKSQPDLVKVFSRKGLPLHGLTDADAGAW